MRASKVRKGGGEGREWLVGSSGGGVEPNVSVALAFDAPLFQPFINIPRFVLHNDRSLLKHSAGRGQLQEVVMWRV